MKQSHAFIPTIQKVPSETQLGKSYEMLLCAGFVRNTSNGVYSYLPLAKRVLSKIEQIIHEEMEEIQACEILLPMLDSIESYQHTNSYNYYSNEIFNIKDKSEVDYFLSPVHEERIASIVKEEVHSYKQFPFIFYQIQNKFRDENVQNGLFRSREFIMNDAYSFHKDEESLQAIYEKMEKVYSNILGKLGLSYKAILADKGISNSDENLEFIVLSKLGDLTVAYSDQSDYAANINIAIVIENDEVTNDKIKELTKVASPKLENIEEVSELFNVPTSKCIQSKVYDVNGELVVILVRGDHVVNETKLKNMLSVPSLKLAIEEEISLQIGCTASFVGPVKLPVNIRVFADHGIKTVQNGIAGANEEGFCYINVNPERDFAINAFADFRYIQEGDPSPDGQGKIKFAKGYEVGHIFKLGTTFTEKLGAMFMDEDNQPRPMLMGSYRLGVTRLLAVLAEYYQDDKGFTWPKHLAPYSVHLITENVEDEEQLNLSEQLYNILKTYRFDVLFDDRNQSIDSKIIDADLIGLPIRVIIGKKASEGKVEAQIRQTGESFEWAKEELVDHLNEFFRAY